MCLLLASSSWAEEPDYGEAIRYKLGSGFSNMLLGLGEVPKNVINTANETNALFGISGGLVKGVLHTLGRTLAGTVDVLTFPVPTKPITHPPYVWQGWKTETTYGPYFSTQKPVPSVAGSRPVQSP